MKAKIRKDIGAGQNTKNLTLQARGRLGVAICVLLSEEDLIYWELK